MAGLTYRDAGVDIDIANDLVEAIKPLATTTARPGASGSLGGFGALFDLKASGYDDPILVSGTDGVGTKLALAIEAGIHDTVGVDCVAMCVNDVVVQGAEPLFFLDYLTADALDLARDAAIVGGIARGCRAAGCALIGGESAEHPGLHRRGACDLAGFCVGAVERDALLPAPDMEPGDILLGLSSSGVHANGFSLVRKILALRGLDVTGPAPFAPGQTVAGALLEPTRIYVASCLEAIRSGGVKGLAHITGGGLTEHVARILPTRLAARIDAGAWRVPEVFRWLARGREDSAVAPAEMIRTFNCGIGMVLVVAPERADIVARILENHGETVTRIGQLVRAGNGGRVTVGNMADDWPA